MISEVLHRQHRGRNRICFSVARYAKHNGILVLVHLGSFEADRLNQLIDVGPVPHYHIHVFAMNATFDDVEKEWKALEVGNTVGDRTF
jgi:hypothetical protein